VLTSAAEGWGIDHLREAIDHQFSLMRPPAEISAD
jgi:hypothetical protein